MLDPDRLKDLFQSFGAISVRRMFGGQGIYHDGLMFALVADGEVYLKVDDETRARFAAAGSAPFTYAAKGAPIEMSYWRAPEAALDDPDEMKEWATLAYQAALRGRKPKRRTGRRAAKT